MKSCYQLDGSSACNLHSYVLLGRTRNPIVVFPCWQRRRPGLSSIVAAKPLLAFFIRAKLVPYIEYRLWHAS